MWVWRDLYDQLRRRPALDPEIDVWYDPFSLRYHEAHTDRDW